MGAASLYLAPKINFKVQTTKSTIAAGKWILGVFNASTVHREGIKT